MKKAIIIGASTGIGRALTKVLLENDYKVGITGVEKKILSELTQIPHNNLNVKYLDCTTNKSSRLLMTLSSG